MPESYTLSTAFGKFKDHYKARLGQAELSPLRHSDIKIGVAVTSENLKPDNSPMILCHYQRTPDVIVLTHGLSDSPYYMLAIGKRFYRAGFNIVLPLLPGHGLLDPDKAMEDIHLDRQWRQEIDQAVEVAQMLGDRVSIGGFSTGGALSLNKILRDPKKITGGLFLFSGALDLGSMIETLSGNPVARFLLQSYLRVKDGVVAGTGLNPYKFPRLPKFAGPELGQIIVENERYLRDWEKVEKKISIPVFAVHSAHDTTVRITGLLEVLKNHVKKGLTCILSESISHSELVLAAKNPVDDANPQFAWMMDAALDFFKKNVAHAFNIAKSK